MQGGERGDKGTTTLSKLPGLKACGALETRSTDGSDSGSGDGCWLSDGRGTANGPTTHSVIGISPEEGMIAFVAQKLPGSVSWWFLAPLRFRAASLQALQDRKDTCDPCPCPRENDTTIY